MKTNLRFCLGLTAAVLLGGVMPAQAADVDVRINLPGVYQPPPPPVYVQPARVYVQPAPVIVQAPAQVVYDDGHGNCGHKQCKGKKHKKNKNKNHPHKH